MSVQAYEQHGLQVTGSTTNQVMGDCPFCGKEDHFFTNREDGRWDCKSCMTKGNLYTFLQKTYEEGLRQTNLHTLRPLSQDRHLPIKALRKYGVVIHPFRSGAYLLPHYNLKGSLSNLYIYNPGIDRKFRMLSTAGCSQHLFGNNLLNASLGLGQKLILAEGHWDAMAAGYCFGDDYTVLGLVGAAFKQDWLEQFEGQDVMVICDNDPVNEKTGKRPGEDLKNRVLGLLSPIAARLSSLKWEPDHDVNDLRDYWIENCAGKPGPEKLFRDFVLSRQQKEKTGKAKKSKGQSSAPAPIKNSIEPLPCDNIEDLYTEFRKHFSLSPRLADGIAITYAVHASLLLPGRPLWLFLVGGAATSKTTTIALLEDHDMTVPIDHLTGLHSGLKRGSHDASLIPEFNGNTVVFKDWTNILSLSPGEQERILREFRDIYDGRSTAKYRNDVEHVYDQIVFNMVAGTTPRVHAHNRAELGERFLKFELSKGDTRETRLKRANAAADQFLDQVFGRAVPTHETLPIPLRRISKGFCQSLFAREFDQSLSVTDTTRKKIISLASLISVSRTKAERQGTELLYRPEAEGEPRLTLQLLKLLLGLAHVRQCTPQQAWPTLREVGLSTAWSFPFEILSALYSAGRALTTDQIAETIGLSKTSVVRHLGDMKEIGSIKMTQRTNTSGRQGRKSNLFSLDPAVHKFFKDIS